MAKTMTRPVNNSRGSRAAERAAKAAEVLAASKEQKTEDVVVENGKELDIYHKIMGIRSIVEQRRFIRFDLAIQRNEVWKETKDVHQRSLLIDSILQKFPIGQVFVIQMGDEYLWMADGKQRWTTVFKYVDNGFPLAKGLRPVKATNAETGETKMYDIEGKYFKDLDKVLQSKILGYEMDVKFLTNATTEQIEEIFLRLNNGTPLTKIELTRVELGEENVIKLTEIANQRFFSTMTAIGDNARNRFIDFEMLLQILMITMKRDSGINGKDIKEFAKAVRISGLDDELLTRISKITDYLGEAFEQFVNTKEDGKEEMPLLNKMLKKVHVPIIFNTAIDAINQEIHPEVFGLWVKSFFIDRKIPVVYKDACAGGSASKDSVNKRITTMKAEFKKHIANVQKEWEDGAVLREQLERERAEEEEAARLAALKSEEDGGNDGGEGENEGSGEGDGNEPPSEEIIEEVHEEVIEENGEGDGGSETPSEHEDGSVDADESKEGSSLEGEQVNQGDSEGAKEE